MSIFNSTVLLISLVISRVQKFQKQQKTLWLNSRRLSDVIMKSLPYSLRVVKGDHQWTHPNDLIIEPSENKNIFSLNY